MTRSRRSLLRFAAAGSVLLALAGCTQAEPMPTPTPDRTTASASPTPEPTPEPVFDGTAQQNKQFFDATNLALIDSGAALNGEAFVAELVRVGYPRAAMEVTPDTTAIGLDADNIQFSIRFDDTCLIGQWGNIGYASLVADVMSTGRCLIGTARPA